MTLELPTWMQVGSYAAVADRLALTALSSDGIVDPHVDPVVVLPAVTDLAVTPNATTLAVDVAPGMCFINGTDQVRQGRYACRSTATTTVTLSPRPSAGQTRIDLVYAQVKDSAAGVVIPPGTDGWVIAAVTGTPSGGTPTVPALPTSALALARVNVVSGAAATFAPGDITDVRHRAVSAGAIIPKQAKAATQVGSTDQVWTQASANTLPGCDIQNIATYTPNVWLNVAMTVDVLGTAPGAVAVTFSLLRGVGPAVEWTSSHQLLLRTTAAALEVQGTLTAAYLIPNPGTYWLRMSGICFPGSPNVTAKGVNSSMTASWVDIVGPTG